MNKTAIKNFAIWARNKLIAEITYKAGLLGITEKEVKSPLPQSSKDVQFFDIGTREPYSITGVEIEQRAKLVAAIQQKEEQSDYKTAFKSVVEEVAYTWFNRLIAVRFMEVNDYLPSRIRVLSSESSTKAEPDLVTTPFDADLEYTPYEKDRIMQLKHDNKLDELFRMLFIKQCNALNVILPELFEKTNDYTELLLNVSYTDKDGMVYHLVHDIDEADFKEAVEIIGWMYQFYISEKHEEVVNVIGGKSIKKEDIPAATQLFTTDWVVRYMVDNSLGRYWIERNPDSNLKEKLEFFISPQKSDITYIDEKVDPTNITFFDPCMGSGHILVYAFEVFMAIYEECGYSQRDAAKNIITNNLFGLDIDKRAYQLAYFAVMMKARSYNRRILLMDININVCAIYESNGVTKFTYDDLTFNEFQNNIGEYLINTFRHAKELGSLQTVDYHDYISFADYLDQCITNDQLNLFTSIWMSETLPLMRKLAKQAEILKEKYTVVCTNPPYMNKLESHLKEFVTTRYKAYSGDLFSVFMYRNLSFCKEDGYAAYMTPNVWMFLKTYENLRKFIVEEKSISSLIQMAKGAFFKEAVVDICTFVLANKPSSIEGIYIRLEDFKGDMDVQKEKVLEAINTDNCSFLYSTKTDNFSRISGIPIAYWVKNYAVFSAKKFSHSYFSGGRNKTHNNDVYVRTWWEVKRTPGWRPYSNGGVFRKWYGNNTDVVNWTPGARDFYRQHGGLLNEKFWDKEGITWNDITSGLPSFRIKPADSIFSSVSPTIFNLSFKCDNAVLGFLNSKVSIYLLNITNPTLHTLVGNVLDLPDLIENVPVSCFELVATNIKLAKMDWDFFETSCDFKRHPFLTFQTDTVAKFSTYYLNENDNISSICSNTANGWVENAFKIWRFFSEAQFKKLKSNEEELNRIFIELYGLKKELCPQVEEKDVIIRKADLGRDVRSFISYAVGCMFGRYSLDLDGLAFDGGEWDDCKYNTFIPNKDNILPISDEEYFEDDIVGLFCAFVKISFGADNLEENLDFIANSLGNKGNTSREVIRNYFLKDFFKDHCKGYQKRPIYWLFDSGKTDGFKALIYLHRYSEDTIGNLRIDYLHRMQRVYDSEVARMQETIDNSDNAREVAAATKRKEN